MSTTGKGCNEDFAYKIDLKAYIKKQMCLGLARCEIKIYSDEFIIIFGSAQPTDPSKTFIIIFAISQ